MKQMIAELSRYLRGWRGYFGFCELPATLENLDSWVRRRVRRGFWWQWKTRGRRLAEMIRLGTNPDLAARAAGSHCGPWRASGIPALHQAVSNAYLASLGRVPVAASGWHNLSNRRIRDPYVRWCGRGDGRPFSLSR